MCQVEAAAAEEESDEEEGAIYNPLKLPMGWDGKPIPYWLYKLHGLGQVRRDGGTGREGRGTFQFCGKIFITILY